MIHRADLEFNYRFLIKALFLQKSRLHESYFIQLVIGVFLAQLKFLFGVLRTTFSLLTKS